MSANKINTISFNIDVAPKAHDMGRNLLRGAALTSLDNITEGGIAYRSIHSSKDNMHAVVDGIDGNKGYQITTGSDETNVYRGVFFLAAVNKGETYTVSAWVKGTEGVTLCLEFVNNNGTERKNSDGTSGTYQSATFTLTDGWQRVSHTFTVDTLNAGYVECNFFTNEPGTFTISEPKLERGDVATAFCLNEADLASAVYDVVFALGFNATYAVDNAKPDTLDLTISGSFFVYTVVDGLRKQYEGDDLTYSLFVGIMPVVLGQKITKGVGTISCEKSNISASEAAVTAMLIVGRGSSEDVATKNITISMHPNVIIDNKNGLLVKVNDNAKSITEIKTDGKHLSATVQEIGDGLLATGVDISKHKFIATADKFFVQNNSGDQTFSIDEYGNIVGAGDAYFKGTITGSTINGGTINGSTIYSTNGTITTKIEGGQITSGNDACKVIIDKPDGEPGGVIRLTQNTYDYVKIGITDKNGDAYDNIKTAFKSETLAENVAVGPYLKLGVYNGKGSFPDFSFISKNFLFNKHIDAEFVNAGGLLLKPYVLEGADALMCQSLSDFDKQVEEDNNNPYWHPSVIYFWNSKEITFDLGDPAERDSMGFAKNAGRVLVLWQMGASITFKATPNKTSGNSANCIYVGRDYRGKASFPSDTLGQCNVFMSDGKRWIGFYVDMK